MKKHYNQHYSNDDIGRRNLIRAVQKAASRHEVSVYTASDETRAQIDKWWKLHKNDAALSAPIHGRDRVYGDLIEDLKMHLRTSLNTDRTLHDLQSLGGSSTQGGVYVERLFEEDDPKLAYIVHEAISDLAGLRDAKYPHEEHKVLYLKPEGLTQAEWGNGLGAISPHMDDPYEEIDTHLLGLTTCRNELGIPTEFVPLRAIVAGLEDDELYTLLHTRAAFYSGRNVEGVKVTTRNILGFSPETGQLRFYFDARDETHNIGAGVDRRMQPLENEDLVRKIIEDILPDCKRMSIPTETGTYLIVSNEKGLHTRQALRLEEDAIATIQQSGDDLKLSPRVLFRSKGSFQAALARESFRPDGYIR